MTPTRQVRACLDRTLVVQSDPKWSILLARAQTAQRRAAATVVAGEAIRRESQRAVTAARAQRVRLAAMRERRNH